MGSSKAAVPLTEYQRRWVNDKSRFKIGVITRQGGKSFGTSLEAVDDCYANHRAKWVFLSAGERQSKELMLTAANHARAYGMAIREIEGEFRAENDEKFKQLEILIPKTDSRIIGLPANPNTARGHSAHLLLDEFAFHRHSRNIWKALFPTVTRGYKIRIISTFQGKSNKFYELMHSSPTLQRFIGPDHEYVGERGGWSKHIIDIYNAVQMGLVLRDEEGKPCEPEDLRLALNDDDAWQEEFECLPSDEAHSFLSHDLISSVEDPRLILRPEWVERLVEAATRNYESYRQTKIRPPLPLDTMRGVTFEGQLHVGVDIGRKKDLTVVWVDELLTGILRSAAVIDLKATPFFIQEQVIHTIYSHPAFRRACMDETGIGAQLAESSVDLFGAWRIEPVTFTPANKEALAGGLKQNFEDRKSLIPADHRIRNSLHSVKRMAASTGHFRFDAERTDETGHADHFWAKGLAVQSAGNGAPLAYGSSDPESMGRPVRDLSEGVIMESGDQARLFAPIFSGMGRIISRIARRQ